MPQFPHCRVVQVCVVHSVDAGKCQPRSMGMEQAHVPALGSWTSSPVGLSIPNRTGDPKGWQVAVTPRTFPALLNVPLGPAPLARPWSQPAFLLGKLPASSRCNIKNQEASAAVGWLLTAKDRPWHHPMPPPHPKLSLSVREEMGLCPSVPTMSGTWGHLRLCFRRALFIYHW